MRRFLPFANGTPSHDHRDDIFASLDPVAFRRCFVAWVGGLTKAAPKVIAIEGKTSRHSGRKGDKDTIHMVSAFAARQRVVLAQPLPNASAGPNACGAHEASREMVLTVSFESASVRANSRNIENGASRAACVITAEPCGHLLLLVLAGVKPILAGLRVHVDGDSLPERREGDKQPADQSNPFHSGAFSSGLRGAAGLFATTSRE